MRSNSITLWWKCDKFILSIWDSQGIFYLGLILLWLWQCNKLSMLRGSICNWMKCWLSLKNGKICLVWKRYWIRNKGKWFLEWTFQFNELLQFFFFRFNECVEIRELINNCKIKKFFINLFLNGFVKFNFFFKFSTQCGSVERIQITFTVWIFFLENFFLI